MSERHPTARSGRAGFSLLELLIIVWIVSMLAVAVVTVSLGGGERRLVERVEAEVVALLREARTVAISEERTVVISAEGTGGIAQHAVYAPGIDLAFDQNAEPEYTTTFDPANATGVTVSWPTAAGVFLADGTFSSDGGAWQVLLAHPRGGMRFVRVLPTGLIRFGRLTGGA